MLLSSYTLIIKKNTMNDVEKLSSIDVKLSAIIAILSRFYTQSQSNNDVEKLEIILRQAGLKTAEIAPLVGKNIGAVRKTLQRSQRANK